VLRYPYTCSLHTCGLIAILGLAVLCLVSGSFDPISDAVRLEGDTDTRCNALLIRSCCVHTMLILLCNDYRPLSQFRLLIERTV